MCVCELYLLAQLHGTQFGRLGSGVYHDIKHCADGLRDAEVCGPTALLQLHFKCHPRPERDKVRETESETKRERARVRDAGSERHSERHS